MSIIEKAKWWAYQYLRMITGKSINFFLCKIQAADWNIVSKREWENEFFRQVDQVLRQKEIVQDLPEFSQDFTEEFERIAGPTNNQGGPNNDENSGWFTFRPNMNRTEVRVYAQLDDDGNRVSTIEDIESIMKGICGVNPDFPLYHAKRKEKEKENTNTSSKENEMRLFHKNQTDGGKNCIYMKGYAKRGTINVQGIGGGGNLPLDKEGTLKLGIALFDCIPKAWLQTQQPEQSMRRLRIYWIGCGFGEEILCICKLAKKFKFPLFILATDIEEACVNLFQSEVELHRLSDYVQVQTVDVYATESIGDDYDIVYTQAAIGSLFTLKVLSLALNCPSVQYLLCNHTHCVYVDEEENQFRQVARARLALVDARLEAGNHRKGKRGEERWIYALDISRYVFFFTKYLSMAFIKCNIYFTSLCDRLRSRKCLNKVRSSMQQVYDNSFEKQFGSVDDDGTFKPPTSSSYNKVSSILGSCSNVESSISIETFHSITPPIHENTSESSNRNRSQRVQQLKVSVQEMSAYREGYQNTSSDRIRQGVIQSFWSEIVLPKALDIWKQQKVMNEVENITAVEVDKLTLRGLTKQNRKDGWGTDNLGNEEDDDDEEEEVEE